ncbi:LOW QUALITY PROTEIN: hypothetical protein RJ641_014041 [Dillenia turbinata]|uniref:Uncharacterized protein n=1 Tax=Dillenia turbinata TaxID=194707 RepID=A0AAN8WI60_9MAGN
MEFKDQNNIKRGMSKEDGTCINGGGNSTEQIQHGAPQSGFESKNEPNAIRSSSLESEIDAENHARLQSTAEIMQKMDPCIIKVVEKARPRKIEEPSKHKLRSKGTRASGYGARQEYCSQKWSVVTYAIMLLKATSEASQRKSHNAAVENFSPASTALWNVWSERVEAVGRSERVDAVGNLRFSLEGDAIENGNLPLDTMYNADNVTERNDFLRTEGDPGAAGYTIKEASLIEPIVQVFPILDNMLLALHLLASVLDKALSVPQEMPKVMDLQTGRLFGAFALSPEPDLLASRKWQISGGVFVTVPVYQSSREIDVGLLHGGVWKYNTKTSNVFISDENVIDESEEGQHTIKHDVIVSGQDVAIDTTGFEGKECILPKKRAGGNVELETRLHGRRMDPSTALGHILTFHMDCNLRQPPRGTNAILKCPSHVRQFPSRFRGEDNMANLVCSSSIWRGIYIDNSRSLEQWVKLGNDIFESETALMVEQLHFWKVCIQYGCRISYFSDFFLRLVFVAESAYI